MIVSSPNNNCMLILYGDFKYNKSIITYLSNNRESGSSLMMRIFQFGKDGLPVINAF